MRFPLHTRKEKKSTEKRHKRLQQEEELANDMAEKEGIVNILYLEKKNQIITIIKKIMWCHMCFC
jgi:hypothetical protein